MGSVPPLDRADYRDLVARALGEDIGEGDVTTESIVAPDQRARGVLTAKATCVVAGLDVALEVFRQMDPSVEFRLAHGDGERLTAGSEIGTITGSARGLLAAERTALNFLQRLSGIATLTRRFVDAAGGRITILDTRKTTPTLRALEKYAVAVGGATNHRRGLFDAVLIKDNHVRLAGGVSEAVSRARAARPGVRLEVEAQSLAEVDAALDAGDSRNRRTRTREGDGGNLGRRHTRSARRARRHRSRHRFDWGAYPLGAGGRHQPGD
jgi:nicotinate-nucleotide pyrophosphorylase (carboxylating)